MPQQSKTFDYGILDENGDTWFLRKPDKFIPLEIFFLTDDALKHKAVSLVGTMAVPEGGVPGLLKLIVEKLVTHDDIAKRAYDIFLSQGQGHPENHWLRAERELLEI